MWTVLTSVFSSVKLYLLGLIAAIIIALSLYIYYCHTKIQGLEADLGQAQTESAAVQKQVMVISQLRDLEIENQAKANQRADAIRKTPVKDDGPVSHVLLNSLSRL